MGTTPTDIIKRDAKPCACGKTPVWAKLRGGTVVLACPTIDCKLYLAVKGHTISDAVKTWNEEVDRYGKRTGKGH